MDKKQLSDEKEKLMMELGQDLEDSFRLDDEDFFYDRVLFMKDNYDNESERYKSKDPLDKRIVKDYCKEDLVILINQYLRFKRFPYTTENGVVYNFPKGEKPTFYLNDIFSKERLNSLKKYIRRNTK
tara:strand:+ start:557 stop:937 length:381 start_codon:yes stop_codon:yes gene_type:complete